MNSKMVLYVGAQDFLPDLLEERKWDFMNCSHPIYQPIMSAMQKAKEWIQAARVKYQNWLIVE